MNKCLCYYHSEIDEKLQNKKIVPCTTFSCVILAAKTMLSLTEYDCMLDCVDSEKCSSYTFMLSQDPSNNICLHSESSTKTANFTDGANAIFSN